MTTFTLAFFVIEQALPTLYRRQLVAEYDDLMAQLQLELAEEIETNLTVDYSELLNQTLQNEYQLISWINLYEQECTAGQYWWGPEFRTVAEDNFEVYNRCTLLFEDIVHSVEYLMIDPWTSHNYWNTVSWYNLRQIRDYTPFIFSIVEELIKGFALRNNVRVIIWEIEAFSNEPAEILLEIEGRSAELDFMTSIGVTEAAIRQQNYYDISTGGFAIAISGTFQPAYRVLNIISNLQRQILVAMAVISLIVASFFSLTIARPIVFLSSESQKLRSLKFGISTKINRSDEIGDLSQNLNFMSEKLKSTLEDLQTANEKLQLEMEREREQERQRRNLFTSISHELKTPLTILKGEIGGMIDGIGVYKDREMYLASAYDWVVNLERLVAEILTVTRLEGEQMNLDLKQTNLTNLLSEVCQMQAPLVKSQGVDFNLKLTEGLLIEADESQLQMALSNVINNAIFYTKASSLVSVSLTRTKNHASLVVINEGAHLTDEVLENIFNPFYRAEQSRNRHTGGSGLGLFIVKNILDLHRFKYEITNIETGVSFTILIPLCILD